MRVALSGGSSARRNDVVELEEFLGVPLPAGFASFIVHWDGATPEANIFPVGTDNQAGVVRFIPIAEIAKEKLEMGIEDAGVFPVAWAECGNAIVVSSDSGEVFFWDHELVTPLIRIAKDFSAFLESLEPFPMEAVKLEPGQVIRAWIDPEFLRKLKREGDSKQSD